MAGHSPRHVPGEILPVVVVDRECAHVLVAAESLDRSLVARQIERTGDRRVS